MTIATVAELIRLLPGSLFTGTPANARRAVKGWSTDTRSLKTGEVFIALQGESFDGHEFISVAAERGASVAIVAESRLDRLRADGISLPMIGVADPLEAYGRIATAHREAFDIPVIAIAGSNGKTTTKELVADVLASRYEVLRTEGNLNNLIGVPAMMLRLTSAHQAAVIEIGTNAPGEIERLCRILRPTHGLITNIGREHLELLGSVEGVAEEEGALFRYLHAEGGLALVNLDDPRVARAGRRVGRKLTYGRKAGADLRGTFGPLDEMGAPSLHAVESGSGKEFEARLKMPGTHAALNALAAAAVGFALKVPPTKIRRALESFSPIMYKSGYARLAVVRGRNGGRVLNDTYNSNPDSVRAALTTLGALKPERGGRRIVVMGDMRELGASSADEHRGVGQEIAAKRTIDLVLFFGDEMHLAHQAVEAEGAGRKRPTVSLHFEKKEDLIRTLTETLRPEDIVLVKGSRGMKMEEVVRALVE